MATILIAEDEVHILRVTSMWVQRHGHTVLEAADGAIALRLISETSVDMLVSDVNMPNLDGMQLVEQVRRDLGLNLPILLLTARCDQTSIQDTVSRYDVHVYPKPFVPSRLVAEIDRLLGLDVAWNAST